MEPEIPRLFRRMQLLYNALLEEAETQTYGNMTVTIWSGGLVHKTVEVLKTSAPYYSKIVKPMAVMGCIRQLKRGGGTAPSQWELIKEPKIEEYLILLGDQKEVVSTNTTKSRINDKRLDQLTLRVINLEKLMQHIINDAIKDQEDADPVFSDFIAREYESD